MILTSAIFSVVPNEILSVRESSSTGINITSNVAPTRIVKAIVRGSVNSSSHRRKFCRPVYDSSVIRQLMRIPHQSLHVRDGK